MTQYLLSVHHDYSKPLWDDETDVGAIYAAVDSFNKKLAANGHEVFGGGLEDPSTATTVTVRDGATVVTDGPFAEAKERIGGFWVIEAKDLDEALDLAAQASAACQAPVEVRPFQGE
jgi:hypothetical protein